MRMLTAHLVNWETDRKILSANTFLFSSVFLDQAKNYGTVVNIFVIIWILQFDSNEMVMLRLLSFGLIQYISKKF